MDLVQSSGAAQEVTFGGNFSEWKKWWSQERWRLEFWRWNCKCYLDIGAHVWFWWWKYYWSIGVWFYIKGIVIWFFFFNFLIFFFFIFSDFLLSIQFWGLFLFFHIFQNKFLSFSLNLGWYRWSLFCCFSSAWKLCGPQCLQTWCS